MNTTASTAAINTKKVGKMSEHTEEKKTMSACSLTYLEKNKMKSEPAQVTKNSLESPFETAKGIKILIVEDSISVRLALQEELAKEGYQVLTAENGRNAFEILHTSLPDLILSDVYMPEMDGMELCDALRRNPLYSHIPIVVMSTENDSGNMRKIMDYGAAAFILKPFNIEQLIITLNNILSYEFMLLLKEKERLTGEQKLLLAGISSLVTALEARDQYTRGHSERVSFILAGLVEHSGGSNFDIQRAQMAGRLHDIGKIGIRDNVLLKPGRLSCDEFEHIQEHPSIGASIIKTIPSISDILPVVYSHHERTDGNGYPQGLSGQLIPLWARMTAVADTYDALTSVRPYRKGMPHEKALEIIDKASGSQFCPDTVRLFLEWCLCAQPEHRFRRFNPSL